MTLIPFFFFFVALTPEQQACKRKKEKEEYDLYKKDQRKEELRKASEEKKRINNEKKEEAQKKKAKISVQDKKQQAEEDKNEVKDKQKKILDLSFDSDQDNEFFFNASLELETSMEDSQSSEVSFFFFWEQLNFFIVSFSKIMLSYVSFVCRFWLMRVRVRKLTMKLQSYLNSRKLKKNNAISNY